MRNRLCDDCIHADWRIVKEYNDIYFRREVIAAHLSVYCQKQDRYKRKICIRCSEYIARTTMFFVSLERTWKTLEKAIKELDVLMPKLSDIPTNVDLADEKVHIVEFDPNSDVRTEKGRSDDYYVANVTEDGFPKELSMGKRLISAIKLLHLTKKAKISIQRTGKDFGINYIVELVK